MLETFDASESPFIRISRNGSVTEHQSRAYDGVRMPREAMSRDRLREQEFEEGEENVFTDDESVTLRASRTMPKRLSEQVREEAEERERRAQELAAFALLEEEAARREAEAAPRAKATRKARSSKRADKKAAAKLAAEQDEQMILPLKAPKEKPDTRVKQRQVVGLCCIIFAILSLIAIVTYSRDDAGPAETRLSDIPSLFLPHGDVPDPIRDQVRANR